MSEQPSTNPEIISQEEKEAQGIALAKEINLLRAQARTDEDRQLVLQKLAELRQLFNSTVPATREPKLSGEIQEQIKQAKEILGDGCLGIVELKNAFGIELSLDKIPLIPFSREELLRAKDLGQFLVLRVDKFASGEPLTIKNINKALGGKTKDEGKILYSDNGTGQVTDDTWYKDEDFFINYTPKLSWALTTKEVIPNSLGKNYLEQTQILSDYIKTQVFKDQELPQIYEEAIKEFNDYYQKEFNVKTKEEIDELLLNDLTWKKYAQELSNLKIQQFRLNEFTDILNYNQNNNQGLLEDTYTRTRIICKTADSSDLLMSFGNFAATGADVVANRPGFRDDGLGVSFSRCLQP